MTRVQSVLKDFINLIETIGPAATARKLKCNIRNVYKRRTNIERKRPANHAAASLRVSNGNDPPNIEHAARLHYDCLNGTVLVGSDAHIWPGPTTTAMRGFIKFAKELKPRVVVMNGDVMDHPQISRHPPIGWEKHPTVEEEIRRRKNSSPYRGRGAAQTKLAGRSATMTAGSRRGLPRLPLSTRGLPASI
jgi:hypothetical protein